MLTLYSYAKCLCRLLYYIIRKPNCQILNSKIIFLCLSSCLVQHHQWTEQGIAECASPHLFQQANEKWLLLCQGHSFQSGWRLANQSEEVHSQLCWESNAYWQSRSETGLNSSLDHYITELSGDITHSCEETFLKSCFLKNE